MPHPKVASELSYLLVDVLDIPHMRLPRNFNEVQAYRRVGAVNFFQQVIEGHLNCVYAKMFGAFVLIRGHFFKNCKSK